MGTSLEDSERGKAEQSAEPSFSDIISRMRKDQTLFETLQDQFSTRAEACKSNKPAQTLLIAECLPKLMEAKAKADQSYRVFVEQAGHGRQNN